MFTWAKSRCRGGSSRSMGWVAGVGAAVYGTTILRGRAYRPKCMKRDEYSVEIWNTHITEPLRLYNIQN